MERAKVNGVELDYEVSGSGEPVLLIDPILPRGLGSFLSLADRFTVIRYDKRGFSGSSHSPPAARVEDHAADAAGLLEHLGVHRAHVVGHSSGAVIGLQLAFDRPDLVQTLAVLEPWFLSSPSAQAVLERAAPILEAYGAGCVEEALVDFLVLVSGFDGRTCRSLAAANAPGSLEGGIRDVRTIFEVELPAVLGWEFGAEEVAAISQPVLSVRGSLTGPLWVETAEQLRSWLRHGEELVVEGVGHLLQIQDRQPVVQGVAAFLERHPMPRQVQPAPMPV